MGTAGFSTRSLRWKRPILFISFQEGKYPLLLSACGCTTDGENDSVQVRRCLVKV